MGVSALLDEDERGRENTRPSVRIGRYMGKGDEMEQRVVEMRAKKKAPSSIRYSSLKNHRGGREVSAASEQGHLVLVEPHLVV